MEAPTFVALYAFGAIIWMFAAIWRHSHTGGRAVLFATLLWPIDLLRQSIEAGYEWWTGKEI